jgi:hypothetical protein
MSGLRVIDPAPFRERYKGPASEPGKRPELRWLKVSQLRIDPKYQREIGRRAADNIVGIAHEFKWAKFSVVVVAPIGRDLFAIVDGQCHTTSAALRDFQEVPCLIITADHAEQADAFVAINANVTAMSPLQIHAARLASGNKAAVALTDVCLEAGVTVCRYPVPANKMKPGETLAVAMLQAQLDRFGRDTLIASLSCITRTRRGNAGMIRKQIVEALCLTLHAAPKPPPDLKRLIFQMQSFDFNAQFNAARAKSIDTGAKVANILAGQVAAHLSQAPVPPEDSAAPSPKAKGGASTEVAAPASAMGCATGPRVISVGREQITFAGKSARVTPRAALLVGLLAKAMPNPIGDDFLIAKLWTVRPSLALEHLDSLVAELASVRKLGLEVRSLKGIGRQIVELDK